MKLKKKKQLLQKRRWRIRKKVSGDSNRPRLAVRFSQKHIHAQCIDDLVGHTLAYLSTVAKDAKGNLPNIEGATAFGKLFGEKAKSVANLQNRQTKSKQGNLTEYYLSKEQ